LSWSGKFLYCFFIAIGFKITCIFGVDILIIYSGKIPPEATNDSEQLRITLAKCKSTLANDIGDVALHGIQEYEQSINDNNDNVQNQNAFNLNVNMNLSPVNDNGRNDENINPENTCYFEADGDEKNNIKISQTKTSDRHKIKSRKHSRNRQRKKRKHAEQISSSSIYIYMNFA
jgi:hypothetical protein